MRRRSGNRSIPMTRSAPSRKALFMANWPAAPDRDGIAGLNVAHLCTHVTGGEDIGEKQNLIVAQLFRHFDGSNVCEGNARVFGLSAGIAAEQMRISKDAGRRMAPHLFRHRGIRIRILAERKQSVLAGEAAAAGNWERHHHAISFLKVRDAPAYFDYFAHELVSEDVAALHAGNEAVVEMQV